MDERNGLQHEVWNVRGLRGRILDAKDRIRSTQRKLQQATRY
jgi:hypothetical protein